LDQAGDASDTPANEGFAMEPKLNRLVAAQRSESGLAMTRTGPMAAGSVPVMARSLPIAARSPSAAARSSPIAARSVPVAAPPLDEPVLAAGLAARQAGALEGLVEKYGARLQRLVGRLTAWSGDTEDLVQDVFVAAWERAHTFRGQSSLETWLVAIALNRARKWHRARRVARAWYENVKAALAGAASNQSPARQPTNAMSDRLHAALGRLRHRDREVLVLYYFDELGTDEIAAVAGRTRSAIEVALHRARQRLRTVLRSDDESTGET